MESFLTFRAVDSESADSLRRALTKRCDSGDAAPGEINAFTDHVDSLKGVDGLEGGPVKDVIDGKNFQGAMREVEVADSIGAKHIDKMGVRVGPKGTDGEIDILLESGDTVEVKRTFGADKRNTFDEVEHKLTAVREYDGAKLDGNKLTIRATEVKNEDSVQDVVEEDIAPELIERRDGWDVVYADQKGGTDAGIDVIARDAGGNYVVTEVKFTGESSTPGNGMFDSFRGDHRQMEDGWIEDAFTDGIDEGSMDDYERYRTQLTPIVTERKQLSFKTLLQGGRLPKGSLTSGSTT